MEGQVAQASDWSIFDVYLPFLNLTQYHADLSQTRTLLTRRATGETHKAIGHALGRTDQACRLKQMKCVEAARKAGLIMTSTVAPRRNKDTANAALALQHFNDINRPATATGQQSTIQQPATQQPATQQPATKQPNVHASKVHQTTAHQPTPRQSIDRSPRVLEPAVHLSPFRDAMDVALAPKVSRFMPAEGELRRIRPAAAGSCLVCRTNAKRDASRLMYFSARRLRYIRTRTLPLPSNRSSWGKVNMNAQSNHTAAAVALLATRTVNCVCLPDLDSPTDSTGGATVYKNLPRDLIPLKDFHYPARRRQPATGIPHPDSDGKSPRTPSAWTLNREPSEEEADQPISLPNPFTRLLQHGTSEHGALHVPSISPPTQPARTLLNPMASEQESVEPIRISETQIASAAAAHAASLERQSSQAQHGPINAHSRGKCMPYSRCNNLSWTQEHSK